ncbi:MULTISPECIES: helix-turn-helix domain-containing protein [Rhodococcus erythropolis group]|uniref:helix-turn-helix domain-containing protein n=1 Tax=Rhodococcus erythropolis group TaxID=2840174 RepID=UPI001ABF2FD9|nr:helix-turn-helix transcriptional regulator [Rhodococcus qingshengii]
MAESTNKKNANALGVSGRTAADNVKRIRTAKNLTYADLSRRLTELDRPIATLGLSRIESYERRIDVDDLIALSIALDVSPNTLLTPYTEDHKTQVALTGHGSISAQDAHNFFEGMRSPSNSGLRFALNSMPGFIRMSAPSFSVTSKRPEGEELRIFKQFETDGETVGWRIGQAIESIFDEDEDD